MGLVFRFSTQNSVCISYFGNDCNLPHQHPLSVFLQIKDEGSEVRGGVLA
jgi:hypothetical protein